LKARLGRRWARAERRRPPRARNFDQKVRSFIQGKYIALVILHTEQTKRRLDDATARGCCRRRRETARPGVPPTFSTTIQPPYNLLKMAAAYLARLPPLAEAGADHVVVRLRGDPEKGGGAHPRLQYNPDPNWSSVPYINHSEAKPALNTKRSMANLKV
jgi:hypothetical protein